MRSPIRKAYSPRRISLLLAGKKILESDYAQPLICKNKLCVNPDHLACGDEARFWAKIQKLNDCWIWIGGQDRDMYGVFTFREDGKDFTVRATHYSWQLYTGRPVPEGIFLCHKCDHPYCVNPEHLFLGTNQDNMEDKVSKGRQTRGELTNSAQLTEEKVKEIRQLFGSGEYSKRQLADKYQVSWSIIHRALLGKTWKHVA